MLPDGSIFDPTRGVILPALEIRVPQMGEGLQEVVIVGLLKKPGEVVIRDEPLYSMETDKAVLDVESPYSGTLLEWLVSEGDVLPIGAAIARLDGIELSCDAAPEHVDTASVTAPPKNELVSPASAMPEYRNSDRIVPPRTRAYCRELGISEGEIALIPCGSTKLLPEDVDRYVSTRLSDLSSVDETPLLMETIEVTDNAVSPAVVQVEPDYIEQPVTGLQRIFTSRVRRSAGLVVPGTMTLPMCWDPLAKYVRLQREQDFTFRPTEFQTLAHCAAQATNKHLKFKCTLQGDETVRIYTRLNLGIAVSRHNGDLVTAVVKSADTLDYREFIREARSSISEARDGNDQADADTQLVLTYLGSYGITEAVPVLVQPAIGVLFIGATYPREKSNWANLTLTFDHRHINGVEAAEFLRSVVKEIETLTDTTLP